MKTVKILALLVTACFAVGCAGVGFEKAWDQAVAEHAASAGSSKHPVSGPWTGTWKTDTNGHTGDLRCLVTPADEAAGSYDFRYHATFFKILRGGYKVNFDVEETTDGFQVNGEKDLGLFGKFKHNGLISGDEFRATYSDNRDHEGSFDMKRPE